MIDLRHVLDAYWPWAVTVIVAWALFACMRVLRERGARARRDALIDAGQGEPVSLHPVVDPGRCVGCAACTNACPEGRIIAMIGGKAQLIDPASCIGHGACKTACPVAAIDLVFGTARRGVEIPVLSANFETTVPGVFVAGELGGMGLIANAIEQGRQAVDAVAALDGLQVRDRYDLVIVGAGPAGLAASLAAKAKGLATLTLEQDRLGGTVATYPRRKIAMTRPALLPLYGRVRVRRARKETLITLWDDVVRRTGVEIHERVRVERIVPAGDGFEVRSSAGVFVTRAVLLATGRRAVPRRLGVAGEERAKVAYGLADATTYRGRHVLVVGGGDSALEAVAALAREPVASLTLAVRGGGLTRARAAQRRKLADLQAAGRVTLMTSTVVERIDEGSVRLRQSGKMLAIANDAVVVAAGGTMPTALLDGLGVRVATHHGAPPPATAGAGRPGTMAASGPA